MRLFAFYDRYTCSRQRLAHCQAVENKLSLLNFHIGVKGIRLMPCGGVCVGRKALCCCRGHPSEQWADAWLQLMSPFVGLRRSEPPTPRRKRDSTGFFFAEGQTMWCHYQLPSTPSWKGPEAKHCHPKRDSSSFSHGWAENRESIADRWKFRQPVDEMQTPLGHLGGWVSPQGRRRDCCTCERIMDMF